MSSDKVDSTSQTATFIKTGFLATALLLNHQVLPVDNHQEIDLLQRVYISSAPSSTFDQYRSSITHRFLDRVDPLVVTMSAVYENLLKDQEALGADFHRVLTENLWDLYES